MPDGSDTGDGRVAVSRRGVLGAVGVAVAGLGAVGLGGAAGAGDFGGDDGDYTAPDDYPLVSTRGDFDDDGEYTDSTRDGYDVAGDWSFDADELVVFVHGWNFESDEAARNAAYTTDVALDGTDADPAVAAYAWDADKEWDTAKQVATRNGAKLANWLTDWQAADGRPVRLVGHSLGARVTCEALRQLAAAEVGDAVQSVALLGGAIDDESVQTDGRYGTAIEAATGSLTNFYNGGDDVLRWAYGLAEFDTAVGKGGIEEGDSAPTNYTDVDVTDTVPDHNSYYEPGSGCVPQVVESF